MSVLTFTNQETGTKIRLTERQRKALARIQRAGGEEAIAPEVSKQLRTKGLVYEVRKYTRYEWNRPVATLSVVRLLPAGESVAAFICAVPSVFTRGEP